MKKLVLISVSMVLFIFGGCSTEGGLRPYVGLGSAEQYYQRDLERHVGPGLKRNWETIMGESIPWSEKSKNDVMDCVGRMLGSEASQREIVRDQCMERKGYRRKVNNVR